jgi:tryptophan halogenase
MKNQIKKIIIVGGGSAGWMSAAMLASQFPEKEIALIESPDVPIIGVGESTLGTINQFLYLLGLKDEDWMEYCHATYKLAIKFTDFYQKGESFYYPFGIKDTQNTSAGIADWYAKKSMDPSTPISDFYESFYRVMPIIYQSKIFDNADNQLPGFSFQNDVAYHMDAVLFGEFLKEKYCEPRGVVYVRQHIDEVLLNDDGEIDGLKLRDGDVLEADLYLDCTGFRSLLLEQTLGVEFTSFSDVLPNNKAWTVQMPYVDKEKEMECTTDCKAIENGWVWNIPLYNRIGTGYVYCNKFISDEDALEQFKQHLNSEAMTVYNPNRTEGLEFRNITIKNGVHKKCWYKNCVAVGLSYGFIEPLESTGLLSVQEILLRLCHTLHLPTANRIHIDNFNYMVNSILHSFKWFVAYHYALSSRRDTPYWKHVTEQIIMDPDMIDCHPAYNSQVVDLAIRLLSSHHIPGDIAMGGIPDIFVGNHTLPSNPTQLRLYSSIIEGRNGVSPEFINSQTQEYWNQKKEYIESLAAEAPSHYQYLKEKIYNGADIEFFKPRFSH